LDGLEVRLLRGGAINVVHWRLFNVALVHSRTIYITTKENKDTTSRGSMCSTTNNSMLTFSGDGVIVVRYCDLCIFVRVVIYAR
jgi:hypothetical protein